VTRVVSQPSSPLGERRLAAGYTQESIAEELGVDRSTIGRWERGTQSPQPWQRPDLATALNVTLEALDDVLRRTRQHHSAAIVDSRETRVGVLDGAAAGDEVRQRREPSDRTGSDMADQVVRVGIPRLRRALDRLDLPEDGPTPSLADLRLEVARLIEHRTEARYVELIWRLPDVLAQLARAHHLPASAGQRGAATLLALALRAADGVAFKFGYLDLSARIIDHMRAAALDAEDPLLMATVGYVRTESFFVTGDLATAARLLTRTADDLLAEGIDSTAAAASYGALHMRAAVVAARAGQTDTAWEHLDEAGRIVHHVPDGVYVGTAFGPSSVRIHELAVAVELGDSPAAVHRTGWWQPPPHLPAERRSHFYIELAAAQLDLGRHEDTYHCLAAARYIAPEHTREHPRVRQALTTLLRAYRSPSTDLLNFAH
jgi:transcriptional regulator with XRE-family HTH domain